MARPIDIAWMVLKQEVLAEETGMEQYAPSPQPAQEQYLVPPKGSPARLQYLAGKGDNLTPEEQAEFLALGGM